MASGLGKTLTGSFDIREFLAAVPNGRVLVLCHSAAILAQTRAVFQSIFGEEYSYGMYNGLEKAAHRTDFLFANLQSVNLHYEDFDPDEFSYVVVDEAHHAPAETYRKAIEYFRPLFLLGLTATPDRMDDADLAGIFGRTVFEYPLESAIRDGWLSDVEYRVKSDEIQRLETILDSGEKFSLSQLNREVFAPKRDEEIIRLIREETASLHDPTMVIFCQTIAHAEKFAAMMGDAVVIHSQLPPGEAEARIEQFRAGKLRTICAVNMLNEGIDVPRTDVIVFLRVTQSKIVFTQQLGRGLRRAKGKGKVLVLDFVSTADRLDMLFQMEHEFKSSVGRYARRKAKAEHEYFTLSLDSPVFTDRKVDIIALIEAAKRIRNPLKWSQTTNEEMLQMLRDLAEELGHTPRTKDLAAAYNLPCGQCYVERFGSFSQAIILAGMTPYGQISNEELLEELRCLAKKLGHTPSSPEVNADPDMHNSSIYRKRFGSYTNAVTLAGLELKPGRKGYTEEELLDKLRICAKRVGRMPTCKDFERFPDLPAASIYFNRFGSFRKALELIGYDLAPLPAEMSDEEMLRLYREFADELGRRPTHEDIDANPKLPSSSAYYSRFGGLRRVAEILKLEYPEQIFKKKYSDEDLIEKLANLGKRLGRTPNTKDIAVDPDMPALETYTDRFGSLAAAQKLAGFKPTAKGGNSGRSKQSIQNKASE